MSVHRTHPISRVLAAILLLAGVLTAQRGAAAQEQTPSPAAVPPSAAPAPVTAAPLSALTNTPRTEAQGDSFLARGRYLAAIDAYEGVEQKTAAVYNKMGIASEHMRLNEQAKRSFETALKLDPKSAEVYNNLGTLAHTEGDYKRAEKFYKKAIKLNPKSADAQKNLGTLYYAHGKYSKGDTAYRHAQELDKTIFTRGSHAPIQASADAANRADMHYHLAKTYAKAGSEQMALEYLRKAIDEGFKDKRRLLTEQEFATLWNKPAFMRLVEDLKMN